MSFNDGFNIRSVPWPPNTPANAAHWTDPDPTTLKQAIDRIAAQLFAIFGSIP